MVRTRALALAGAVAGLVVPAALQAPTHAAAATAAPQRVVIALAAPHPHRLRALAAERGLTRAERVRRLRPLVPSAATRHRVVDSLRARQFRVVATDTWTVTAEAGTARVRSTFGVTDRGRTYSRVPTFLGPAASSVIDDGAGVRMRPLRTSVSGPEFRRAYAPTATPATGQAASGRTVATIQFTDFDPQDVSAYATRNALPAPNLTRIDIPNDVNGHTNTDRTNSAEASLDQEAILSTSPSASQRVYVATNDVRNWVPLLNAVQRDAVADHITALSVSWGICERDGDAWAGVVDHALTTLVASGVTVFAASGDDGIYGCHDTGTSADFPASSPSVVGVGGTALTQAGADWTETGWTCTSATTCTNGSQGSGGGVSSLFGRPVWQTNSLSGTFATGSGRLVPDIAAVGDPATPFIAYDKGRSFYAAGTSLSAPVSAAMYTNALAESGTTTAPGDIHQALYAAYQADRSTVFRDVTQGQNGAAADSAGDPSVCAADGYDTVGGLGGVRWSALLPYLTSTTTFAPVAVTPSPACAAAPATSTVAHFDGGPAPAARTSLRLGRARNRTAHGTARWTTSDATRVLVRIEDLTAHRVLWTDTSGSGSHRLRARVGHLLRVVVSAYDAGGRTATASSVRRTR